MKIQELTLSHFRNISSASLCFSDKVNLFYGQNGSGKTSLLEAIHYLGLGRSFRTRNPRRILHHTADKLTIFAQLIGPAGNLPVGIERSRDASQSTLKIGGKLATALVELASLLPIQLLNADSHLLLTSGPTVRRQFLDWGVFHVEPSFYPCWLRANRCLKQRNAALKTTRSYQELAAWDDELMSCAIQLDEQRSAYLARFIPLFETVLNHLLPQIECKLHYYAGWNNTIPLQQLFQDAFPRDKQLGFTQFGFHRADLQLKLGPISATDILSQGQQKLAAYALRLAQGQLLDLITGKLPIFLIDDLPSELDSIRRHLIADLLLQSNSQLFITGIERANLKGLATIDSKMFHVEHGDLTPV